ncbi:MAG: hypothetical protein IKC94_04305 [Lentisphaeria bacterium]|nr:hypothetical protein [Lentisphaeria bacterium]
MMEKISLDGIWEGDYFISGAQRSAWGNNCRVVEQMLRESAMSSGFFSGAEAQWALKGTIPGCDRTFLLENGLIPDIYYGRNLELSYFSEKHSWAFRKKFTIPENWHGRRIILEFARLDYHAIIFLNGEYITEHANMSYGISVDITGNLKSDEENVLCVLFDPAPQGEASHYSDRPADFAKFHRTQIGFGWDWSRKLVPTGIVDSVTLCAYENCRITDIFCHFDGVSATLFLEVEARKDMEQELLIQLATNDDATYLCSTSETIQLAAGKNFLSLPVSLPENLQLWYPNGSGRAALYRLGVTLDGFTEEKLIGFRTVTMTRNPDSPENAYDLTFNINGKAVFVKGADYVPADLMLSQVKSGDYEHLVRAAHAAGINFFRIWGGGVIEKDAFYEACDHYGIMVWQEFMHACSQYPKDAAFLAVKEREGREIIRKLRNHPCITLFCGGNELQYYGEIPDSPMLKKYGELVAELMPGIPYHITSPDLSRPGERHHGPWHWRTHGEWNTHFRCFASELGCNGMPEYSTLRRFIPENELSAMDGPALAYHFFNKYGVNDLSRPVKEFFDAENMEKFCAASIFSQADLVQYIMEHYRRLAPGASGCVFWQYNEPWPTCSWNLIDYYGYPKMALYALKRANAPVLLSLKDDSWACKEGRLSAKWFITCDEEFSGKVAATAYSADGEMVFSMEKEGLWAKGTTLLAGVDESLPEGLTAVFFTIDGKYAGVRIYGVPDFRSFFALQTAQISAKVKDNTVTVCNTGRMGAFNIRLAFPALPDKAILFTDNYLTLAPGESREVTFLGDAQSAALQVDSLNQKVSLN